MRTRTIFVPSDHGVMECLRAVEAAGLLGDSLVADLRAGEAKVVVDGVVRHVASSPLDALMLVVLRSAPVVPGDQLGAELLIWEQLRAQCTNGNVKLVAGVVVALAPDESIDLGCFHVPWNFNVLVEPEESFGVDGYVSAPSRPESSPWAALTVALAGTGQLAASDAGFFLDEQANFGNNQPHVRLARAHVRLVDIGDIASRLVELALFGDGAWPRPDDTEFIEDAGSTIAELAATTQPLLGLSYHPPEPLPGAPRLRMGFRMAVRLIQRRAWSYVRRESLDRAHDLRDRTMLRVQDIAQAGTLGRDADIVVALTRAPDTLELVTESGSRSALVESAPALVVRHRLPQADTWRRLRSVLFGLVDGSDFVGPLRGSEPNVRGRRGVVDDIELVASDPVSRARPAEAFAVTSEESERIGLGSRSFSIGLHDARAAGLLSLVVSSGRQASEDEPPDQAGDGIEPAVAVGDAEASNAWPAPTNANGRSREELGADLERWRGQRSANYCWLLADRLQEAEQAALDDFATATRLWDELPSRFDAVLDRLRAGRRAVLGVFVATIGVLVVLLALALLAATVPEGRALVGTPDRSDLGRPAAWLALATLPAAVFGWVALIRASQRCFAAERELEALSLQPDALLEMRQHCADEALRLGDLYEQLIDWADICGSVLGRPLGRHRRSAEEIGAALAPIYRNFVVGVPTEDAGSMAALALGHRRDIVSVGWLDESYRVFERYSAERYSSLSGVAVDDVDPAHDASIGSARVGLPGLDETLLPPRKQLLDDLAVGRFADEIFGQRRRYILDRTTNEQIVGLVGSVRAEELAPQGTAIGSFLSGILTSSAPSFGLRNFPEDDPRRLEHQQVSRRSQASTLAPADGRDDRSIQVAPLRIDPERALLSSHRIELSLDLRAEELVAINVATESMALDDDEGDLTV